MEEKRQIGPLIGEYIDYIDIKLASKIGYQKVLLEFAAYVDRLPNLPTRLDVMMYREKLKTRLKAASVQKHMVVIRNFYRWYHMVDYGKNVAEGVKGMKIESTFKREALSVDDSRRLLNRAKFLAKKDILGKRNYALVSLLITTGLRTIEIERSNVEDINYVDDGQLLYIQGKGHDDKDSFVKLSVQVYAIIEEYLMERNDEYQPLFIDHASIHQGERMQTRNIRRVVKELFRQIGIDSTKFSAHSLRHTTATLSLMEGANIEETQQLLRHKDPATTQIYIHRIRKMKDHLEWKISDTLFGDPKKKK
jgi:integrase/recombinase XerC/integrase/recombinase XerD